MSIRRMVERLPRWVVIALGVGLITALAVTDHVTGTGISFSILYLVPISLLAWYGGRWAGLLGAGLSAVSLLVIYELPQAEGTWAVPFWNSSARFVIFVIVVRLLTSLHAALEREMTLARTDYLTGAANARAFHEAAEAEIERMRRYGRPFTIAYMDVDDFKTINDRLGHSVGNELLRALVVAIEKNLRATDMVARLGGDEFAVLLPEAGQVAARDVVQKIQSRLAAEMQANEWPVSFSIGVLTCQDPPRSVNNLLKFADDLMYAVKRSGKNDMRHQALVAQLTTEGLPEPRPLDDPQLGA